MMKRDLSVLFCSVGPRAELIECFRSAAQVLGLSLRVLATEEEPEASAGCRVADKFFRVPSSTSPAKIKALLKICRSEGVSLLVPIVGEDLVPLSESVAAFRAVGTRVVVSSRAVVQLERDKLRGAEWLAAAGITIPHTTTLSDFLADPDRLDWPVIAKPVAGSSSVGILRPRWPDTLRQIAGRDYVVQELWQGREYTVNMFFDRRGRWRCAVPHLRMEVRTGEVWKGRTERVPILHRLAQRLGETLRGARGPIGFQAIINEEGKAAVLELNARFGGGYPLTHQSGANFARWLLEETAGLKSSANDTWAEGVTMLRYDAAVFFK